MTTPYGSILLVDDEKDITHVLTLILNKYVADIQVAHNGVDALKKIKNGSFDAVLSDIKMPQMSGLQLLAEVRALGIEVPFLILTGFGDKEKIREALRLGATDFIDKPFDPISIVKVITRAI